jgi:UDP-N-acetylglucosamine--N-acetylmuramyl-(pentapeptide) pyrophosphoryl-undecaprenol N-acetylglucosamine transferase
MEKDLVPKAGFEIKYIHASGLSKGIGNKINAVIDLTKGISECKKIIEEEKPDMCIGTGGYVTAPLMMAAQKLKVHTLIHESNALPGKTTTLMAPKIDEVAVGFDETKEKLLKGNIVVTGNPNKMGLNKLTKVEAKEKINIDDKILLIFGGSQGAKKINETILALIKKQLFENYTVIYATGPKHFEEISNIILEEDSMDYEIEQKEDELVLYRLIHSSGSSFTFTSSKNGPDKEVKTVDTDIALKAHPIIVKKFIYNMEEVMKAADLVISRSGALTCTEIAEVGVASILIPFPYAAENHQFYNAETLQNAKAGVIIEEKNLTPDLLYGAINSILDNDALQKGMAENAKTLRKGNPIQNIKDEIYKILS